MFGGVARTGVEGLGGRVNATIFNVYTGIMKLD